MVIFRYSVAKGMIYRGKVLTCIKKHHKMVEICHVTEYVCTSWPRNWINIMRQKPWDNFSTLSKNWNCKKITISKYFPLRYVKYCKQHGILIPKLFWPTVRKNCSTDWEKLLKFEAEGREFAKLTRTIFSNRMLL